MIIATIAAVLSLLLTFYVPGYLLSWALFGKKELDGFDRNLLAFALSVLLVGGFMSFLAAFTTFEFYKTLAFVAVVCAVSLFVYYRREGKLPPLPSFNVPRPGVVGCVVAVFVALSFYHALIFPETSWDALAYHLDFGETFYEKGYVPLNGYNFMNLPNGLHLVYAWLYQWNGLNDVFARLASPLFGLAALCLTYSFARRLFGCQVARYSALLLSAIPLFVAQSQVVYVNLPEAFFAFFSVVMLWLHLQKGGGSYMFASGLLAGFAATVKVSSLFVWPLVVFLLLYYNRKDVSRALKPLIVFTAAFAVVAAPWYLRNLVLFGNPAYPYSLLFFKGALAPANQPLLEGMKWFLLDHKVTYSFGNGPLLLTFGLAGLILARRLGQARFLYAYLALALLAILAFLRIDGRFFLPLFFPLAIFGAYAFARLGGSGSAFVRRAACAVLALEVVFALGFAVIGFKMQEAYSDRTALTLPVPMPFEQAMELRFGSIWDAWKYIDANAGKSDAVAIVESPRPYYYHRDTYIFTETDTGNNISSTSLGNNPAAAVQYLKGLRVRYVLIERRAYHGTYQTIDNVITRNLNNTAYFREAFRGDWASVYEII